MSLCPYYDILQALGTEVRAAVPSDLQVSVRNRPLQLDVVDPVPHVVIWPGEGSEAVDKLIWGQPVSTGTVIWLYPVLVVLVTAGNRVVEEGLFDYLLLRQGIRNAMLRPLLSGAVTVHDMDIVPQDVFDKLAFTKGNYDVTGFQGYYRSSESFINH